MISISVGNTSVTIHRMDLKIISYLDGVNVIPAGPGDVINGRPRTVEGMALAMGEPQSTIYAAMPKLLKVGMVERGSFKLATIKTPTGKGKCYTEFYLLTAKGRRFARRLEFLLELEE